MSIIEAETGRTHRSPPKSDPPLAPRCHHWLFPSSWSYRHVRQRDSLSISGQTDVLLPRIELKRCIYDVRRCTKTEPPTPHRGTDRIHRCKLWATASSSTTTDLLCHEPLATGELSRITEDLNVRTVAISEKVNCDISCFLWYKKYI